MKCIVCESYSLSIICNNCESYLTVSKILKRDLTKEFQNLSFYSFSELENFIDSKYHFYGDKIFNLLAKNSFKKFSEEFNYEENVYIIPIDDHTKHDFSHTAILVKAMKNKRFIPKYNCLKATNIVKYAGRDLEFRQKNPRKFIVSNLKNKKVILVDDLITTGTTILEAKKALERHNNEVLFSLTLADAKF